MVLQFRPDATEIFYEAAFPSGPDAARWRLRFDADHDGHLSEHEYDLMAEGLGAAIRGHLTLRLEGGELPLKVLDARVTATSGAAIDGRFAAAVLFGTRELPPGLRKVELTVDPVADRSRPALVRVETENARVQSIAGGGGGSDASGVPVVLLRRGERCTLLVDVATPPRKTQAPTLPADAPRKARKGAR